jgi:hypothetical protein
MEETRGTFAKRNTDKKFVIDNPWDGLRNEAVNGMLI